MNKEQAIEDLIEASKELIQEVWDRGNRELNHANLAKIAADMSLALDAMGIKNAGSKDEKANL